MYLLSLPESEILPQEQSELRQETHYSLSWQYPAKASLWQLVHLINPGGNKRQSLVLIQRSNASWGSATNHSLPEALRLMVQHLFSELLSQAEQIAGGGNFSASTVKESLLKICGCYT